jgi:hypothetical protein
VRFLCGKRSVVVAVALVAVTSLAACGGGGGDASAEPQEVKSCLDEAGFDTSESTGLISVFSAGKSLKWRDEFAAVRGGDEFLLWFMNSEADARAVAGVVKAQTDAPAGQPRVEGTVAIAYRQNTDPQAVEAVEECLGL